LEKVWRVKIVKAMDEMIPHKFFTLRNPPAGGLLRSGILTGQANVV
jgi:hypothetical protein